MARCPICNEDVRPRGKNPAFPFCSPRCKTVDLGKWLNEDYRVPAEEAGDGASGEGASDERGGEPDSRSRGDMRN